MRPSGAEAPILLDARWRGPLLLLEIRFFFYEIEDSCIFCFAFGFGGDTHGFEDAAGVVAAAHDHASGARNFEDRIAAFDEDLNESFNLAFDTGDFDHQ